MIPIHRELMITIPDELAKFIEDDMRLSLRDFCQKVIVDLIKECKVNKAISEGKYGKAK